MLPAMTPKTRKPASPAPMQHLNATKIICTLGPAVATEESILRLARMGMNIARINMSHASWEQHQKTVHLLKKINAKLAKDKDLPAAIGILLDTKGGEVRTGIVTKPILIKVGEIVVFSTKPLPKEKHQVITVDHAGFGKDAKNAEKILLDNGTLQFDLQEVRKDGSVVAKAAEAGSIGSRRHVNLPGADLSIPSVTDKDWEDIAHGLEEDVDFFALSFIREGREVEEVRRFVERKGKNVGLIAKVEARQAVRHMEEIIHASDGVMVARGDLGAEIDFATIPVIQDRMVSMARSIGKPVIVATHMLESMIENPMPTRAEVTDIAHAVMTATDSTMLSGETASGKYPFESLDAMTRVIGATEEHLSTLRRMEDAPVRGEREAQAKAAVTLAISTDADAIVIMSKTGQTARDVSRFRPNLPILTFTPDAAVQRSLLLHYGVIPLLSPFDDADPEKTVRSAFKTGTARGFLAPGKRCILISDTKTHDLNVSSVQVRAIP